jgi:hypothetical protein
MSAAKKRTNEAAELDAVRQHLLECPGVPKDSRALQVALDALDQERKRMDRDAKLQCKFASSNSNNASMTETKKSTAAPTAVTTTETTDDPKEMDDAELMEWQDVASHDAIAEMPSEDSILGKLLASSSIANMAKAKTDVASPLAAIALALHAALVGETLDFKCTGIPDDSSASSGGFAAPIRQLPPTQLVPTDWDKNSLAANNNPHVKFRYRKNGVGSIVLNVDLKDDNMVHVELLPTNTKEPPNDALEFPLEDHVNLESLSKALISQQRVVPTLHYKALPVLLTSMCNTFDLGPVRDSVEGGTETSLPYVDTTIVPPIADGLSNNNSTPLVTQPRVYDQHGETPNIRLFQQERRRGDFDADLMPGGIQDPFSGGNLMGPHHPAFGQPPAPGGGFGMHPRFDPFGPPGGPTDPNNLDPNGQRARGRRPPPGGTGDPNPDHERPPNNLGNNMFM